MVDSDGLKWTQLDRAELVLGHNLDTVWSFLWVRGLPLVLLARSCWVSFTNYNMVEDLDLI